MCCDRLACCAPSLAGPPGARLSLGPMFFDQLWRGDVLRSAGVLCAVACGASGRSAFLGAGVLRSAGVRALQSPLTSSP